MGKHTQGARFALTKIILIASVTISSFVVSTGGAHADVGDCVTVKGKGGSASKGSAKVCLRGFDGSENGWAKLKVSNQKRADAPNKVYVSFSFNHGGFNTGWHRLGANSPGKYTKTKDAVAAYPEEVRVRLCYDKTFRRDPCFASKTLTPGGFTASP